MGRLTKRDSDGITSTTCEGACYKCGEDFHCYALEDMLDKLAHYEDLEEAGRLIELPCAVGDTVYVIDGVRWKGYERKWKVYDKAYVREIKFNLDMLGDSFYLTKEEAEAKLKELKNE